MTCAGDLNYGKIQATCTCMSKGNSIIIISRMKIMRIYLQEVFVSGDITNKYL